MQQLAKPSRTLPSTSKGLSEASPAGRPVAASLWPVQSLPPLFLWASGLLRPLCGLSEACLLSSYGLPKATLGILDRLQKPLGSRQASCGLSVACPKLASSLLMGFRRQREAFWTGFKSLSAASRPLAASLWPVRSLPPLFLWASEGNVRHFGPASKASRQPAGLLRPLCGLSEACLLSSYGLPASRQPAGLLWPLCSKASRQPAGLLRPLCGLSEACLLSS